MASLEWPQSGPRAKRTRNPRLTRPRGVRVRLIGKNRTGTLVTAQYIASVLRIDLYRVDPSSVVSKYIGETEKQLKRVIDAAENSNAILFFNNADALFWKRT